jgi:hypothetical protein
MIPDLASRFEEQVARGLERAPLGPPPGLAQQVLRALGPGSRLVAKPPAVPRHRGHLPRPWTIATMAAVTAILFGTVVLRSGLPGAAGPTSAGAPSTQLIGARMLAALETHDARIVHVHVTTPALEGSGAVGIDIWSSPPAPRAGDEVRTHVIMRRDAAIAGDEEDVFMEPPATSPPPAARVAGERIIVNHAAQTWSDLKATLVPPLESPGPTPESIRKDIAAGGYRVVGPVSLDGRPAIEFVRTAPGRGVRDERLWVDPGSFLPVREVATAQHGSTEEDFEFLSSTDANLALLQPVIPPGFTRTTVGQ